MTDHHCIQKEKLGSLVHSVERIEKELFNGDEGLIKAVPVLTNNVKQLSDDINNLGSDIKDLRTVISGIVKYTSEDVGMKREADDNKKARLTNFQMFGIVMAAIVGLFSIMGFIKSFVNDKKVDDIDYKLMFKQDRIPDSTTRSIKSMPLDTTRMFKR
jgi:uncharacterized protein (UPF0335 family)